MTKDQVALFILVTMFIISYKVAITYLHNFLKGETTLYYKFSTI